MQPSANSLVVTASAALLLCGCGSAEDLTTSISPPPQSPAAGGGGPESSAVNVTPHQHAYLDALSVAGVYRSSDLTALSIGSYVCQARAAGQGDQAVWDFVFPLVRGDIHDSERADVAHPTAISARDATAQYIRIASERLC